METKKRQRPTGVTIVEILIIIGGILLLLAGIGTVTIGALFFHEIVIGVIFAIIGAILLAVGIGFSCILWIIKRKKMGMDYNHNITSYWNCYKYGFYCFRKFCYEYGYITCMITIDCIEYYCV